MNLRTVSVLVVAVALISGAFAQTGTKSVGAAPKRAQAQRQDGQNAEMRNALQNCLEAGRLLGAGLPIYQGHRASAIQFDRLAVLEIRAGLLGDRLGQNKPTSNAPIPDSANKRNYTERQIQESNQRLVRAGQKLTSALNSLQSAPKDYNGHRFRAIQAVQNAINQVNRALNSIRQP